MKYVIKHVEKGPQCKNKHTVYMHALMHTQKVMALNEICRLALRIPF